MVMVTAWSFFGPPKSKKHVLHIFLHGCNIHANSTYNLYSLLPIHAHLTGVISVGFIGISKNSLYLCGLKMLQFLIWIYQDFDLGYSSGITWYM